MGSTGIAACSGELSGVSTRRPEGWLRSRSESPWRSAMPMHARGPAPKGIRPWPPGNCPAGRRSAEDRRLRLGPTAGEWWIPKRYRSTSPRECGKPRIWSSGVQSPVRSWKVPIDCRCRSDQVETCSRRAPVASRAPSARCCHGQRHLDVAGRHRRLWACVSGLLRQDPH